MLFGKKRLWLSHLQLTLLLFLAACGGGNGNDSSPNKTSEFQKPVSRTPAKSQCEFSVDDIGLDADVIIVGGSPSGIAAGVSAARRCKKVLILTEGTHIGGMMSGGLGATDIGVDKSIGGFAREFFSKVATSYGMENQYRFEPHVAEKIFLQSLLEAQVKVVYDARLVDVYKEANKITAVETDDGKIYRGQIYIDATYEGDLLAMSKAPYIFGREGNFKYGEKYNGVYPNVEVDVDPYVIHGVLGSGLLPHVSAYSGDMPGSADKRVMPYNYRLCVTKEVDNKISFPRPENYNPNDFEALARYIEALIRGGKPIRVDMFLSIDAVPNKKADMNNAGFFSTDMVGNSERYVNSTYETRKIYQKQHKSYMQGLLYFLISDLRVPASLRSEIAAWGLCKDEFKDNDNWPYQLYVREARRLIGQYVITENDVFGRTEVHDSVGLSSYPMDSHFTQRIALNGRILSEGGYYIGVPAPYRISLRSLMPKEEDVSNMLVTVCISASRAAFSSIRVEPTYMIIGAAAGEVAALAVEKNLPVQLVSYDEVKNKLLEKEQVISWNKN